MTLGKRGKSLCTYFWEISIGKGSILCKTFCKFFIT